MKTGTTTSSDNVPQEKERETTTSANATLETGSADWLRHLGDLVNKLSIPRLFLILAFVIYGIISFSKKEVGVGSNDLSIFIFFIIFIMSIFGILVISRDLYRKNNSFNFIILRKLNENTLTLILLILIILVFVTYFRALVLEFISILIKSFVK